MESSDQFLRENRFAETFSAGMMQLPLLGSNQ